MTEALHVWLWASGDRPGDRSSGVTDDLERAMKLAVRGRIERALFVLGMGPVGSYQLLGTGFEATRAMTWQEFPARAQEALAS